MLNILKHSYILNLPVKHSYFPFVIPILILTLKGVLEEKRCKTIKTNCHGKENHF
jgi:hypothetical protein